MFECCSYYMDPTEAVKKLSLSQVPVSGNSSAASTPGSDTQSGTSKLSVSDIS